MSVHINGNFNATSSFFSIVPQKVAKGHSVGSPVPKSFDLLTIDPQTAAEG